MSEDTQIPVETPVEVADTVEQPVDILNDEGKFNESWVTNLPDELGKHSIFQKYDNPIDLIKGSINAQSQVGKKAEDFWLSEDEKDIARKKEIMGVPTSSDEYSFEIGDIPEGTEVDEERLGDFKELAHSLGLTQEQAQKLMEWEVQSSTDNFEQIDKDSEVALLEAEQSLREEWAGDKYEYNMNKVANVMDYLGLGEFKDDPEIGNNVGFIKALFENVVPLISDDEIIQQGMEENFATVSDQLSEIENQMYTFEGHVSEPAYQKMIKERELLLQKLA